MFWSRDIDSAYEKMASVRGTDCYVFGNNLEAILEALEEDDDFESDLCDTANKVSISQLIYLIWEQKTGFTSIKLRHIYRLYRPSQNLAST